MNRQMRNRIIDRYVNGEMSPRESHDFQELLRVDSDLRRLYEEERMIGGSLAGDRESLPEPSPKVYAGFLAALAASSAPGAGSAAGSSAVAGESVAGSAAAASGTGSLGAFLAGGVAKAVSVAVAVVAVSVGTYIAVIDRDAEQTFPAGKAPALSRSIESGPAAPAIPPPSLPGAEGSSSAGTAPTAVDPQSPGSTGAHDAAAATVNSHAPTDAASGSRKGMPPPASAIDEGVQRTRPERRAGTIDAPVPARQEEIGRRQQELMRQQSQPAARQTP